MTDTKISDLAAVTDLLATDAYVLARSGTTKKITGASLRAALGADGWVEAGETWTYASADDPTFAFTVPGDLTAKYTPGRRIKLTQTTDKYFIITAVAHAAGTTTVTLYGGTDYDLANAAITSPFYSSAKAPAGFPLDPAKWTVTTTNTTQSSQASPVNGTWYNIGTISIDIPIGCWRVSYQASIGPFNTANDVALDAFMTLSTANNTESDSEWTAYMFVGDANAAGKGITTTLNREKFLTLAAKSTRYLNAKVTTGGSSLDNQNLLSPCIIRAECAYL